MKNLIFSFLVLILSAGNAFGQISNSEIHKIIMMSKEANVQNGIFDPNKIFPGQKLTFIFEDGHEQEIYVEPGDNQWSVVKNKLSWYESLHGEVVEPNQEVQPQPKETTPDYVGPEPLSSWYFFPWGWLVAFICILPIIIKLLTMVNWKKLREKRKGKFSQSPTTEGKPFVEGGVSAENSRNHFVNLAQRSNPGADIQITNRRQGYLSTVGGAPATVEFGDKTKQKLSFKNEPAFAAMVSINGKPATEEYFFQGCGNPVYSRRSMKAGKNLIFTTEPLNFGDDVVEEKVNQEMVKVETELEKVAEQQKPVVEKKDLGSDEVMMVNDHTNVVIEFFKTQKAHSAMTEYIKNADGSTIIRSTFNTKNEPVVKEEVKKEKEN